MWLHFPSMTMSAALNSQCCKVTAFNTNHLGKQASQREANGEQKAGMERILNCCKQKLIGCNSAGLERKICFPEEIQYCPKYMPMPILKYNNVYMQFSIMGVNQILYFSISAPPPKKRKKKKKVCFYKLYCSKCLAFKMYKFHIIIQA